MLDQERNQLSFEEMQAVLYSNQSDFSDGNLTDVGIGYYLWSLFSCRGLMGPDSDSDYLGARYTLDILM